MSMNDLFGGGGFPKKWAAGTYAEGTPVWSPSDYQYYMRKTTGASATDPASDTAGWQPTGDRAVKSIQRGYSTSAYNGTAITVAAVNTSKTELRYLGAVGSIGGPNYGVMARLSSATTITFTIATGIPFDFSWELTERY